MIRLDGVSVTYPGRLTALHPTFLEFSRNEFAVLLGPSGAGKSTLLRTINYLNRPSAGSVTVAGIGPLGSANSLREHRRRTGMIFQQHQLIMRQTALQNVLMGRFGYHTTLRSIFPLPVVEVRMALDCLERVGLLEKASERVDGLSGGERQRVGIARALAQQPRVVLADEPVASLDPVTATKILSLLQSICREADILAVVSLHQVDLAKTYADRIIGLADGRVVFDGPADRLNPEILDRIYRHQIPGGRTGQCKQNSEECAAAVNLAAVSVK